MFEVTAQTAAADVVGSTKFSIASICGAVVRLLRRRRRVFRAIRQMASAATAQASMNTLTTLRRATPAKPLADLASSPTGNTTRQNPHSPTQRPLKSKMAALWVTSRRDRK